MKKLLGLMMAVLLLLGASAVAEEKNDTTLYVAKYDEAMLTGWYQSLYPLPETLLYANEEEDQILLLLMEKAEYPTAQSYLDEVYETTQEYATVTDYSGVQEWDGAQLGKGQKIGYVARFEDEAYSERVYAAEYGEEHVLVVWFTLTGEDDEGIEEFTSAFLSGLSIERTPFDEWKTGYVRAAQLSGDQVELSIDYVQFDWGDDAFDYTIEDDGENALQVKIAPDASVFIPNAVDFAESMHVRDGAEIVEAIENCLSTNEDLLFEVAILNGEIVWMDYCYVV